MLKPTLCAMLLVAGAVVAFAHASEATLAVEIPRLQVAEYHRPYVSAWVREDKTGEVTNLALWYQLDDKREGEEWLKDLRQWWRRSGRTLDLPIDSFTGATRAPGTHTIDLGERMTKLPPGKYTLYVEAVREVGGRELLTFPFSWPVTKPLTIEKQGDSELGEVELRLQL